MIPGLVYSSDASQNLQYLNVNRKVDAIIHDLKRLPPRNSHWAMKKPSFLNTDLQTTGAANS